MPGKWPRLPLFYGGIWVSECFILCYANLLAPGWLVAAGFETTILAGLLISPLIYRGRKPMASKYAVFLSALLVFGLLVMQLDRLNSMDDLKPLLISLSMSLLAAFLWPLGNRRLMLELEEKNIHLDATQRVLGMTIGSLPILFALAIYGFYSSGLPAGNQLISSGAAALFSGLFGSVLFYKAMQKVKNNPLGLASVEATQVLVIPFTLLAEIALRGLHWPGFYGSLGIGFILTGLMLYTLACMGKKLPGFN